jgi:hypothetical protein
LNGEKIESPLKFIHFPGRDKRVFSLAATAFTPAKRGGLDSFLMLFEILDFLFMFFGRAQRCEGSQVATFICLWIFLPGIEPVFTGF